MLARVLAALLPVCMLAIPPGASAQDEPLRVRAAVQSQRVYVGQQFLLQIQVQGTDQPDPIDVRPLEKDFVVTEAGGGASNSTSVSIVNGRMTQQVLRGYNFNYRLAARRAGGAVIPAIVVTAAGRTSTTQPVSLQVLPPEENDDFRFRLSLSERRAYIGQPVSLTAVWYIGREIQEFSFTMPLLDDRRFEVLDPPSSTTTGQQQADRMEIRLGDRRAVARKGTGELDGRTYTVLRFEKLLIPRESGSVTLPQATVTFVSPKPGPSGRRDPFDDFFGGSLFSGVFGGRRELETLAIPSNRPRLEVLDLPLEGRPPRFNGWIGEFQLRAEAKPTSVAVGEPITLGMTVRGPGMLETARFPDLDEAPELVRDFNVPSETGAGEIRGEEKFFTQTLRARHDRINEIPAIELPYFDPRSGEYRIARSDPIDLQVKPSRIVTAEDAEGVGVAGPRQLEIETREQGIAHNYVDASALQPMPGGWTARLRPLGPMPLALAMLAVPPLVLLGWQVARGGAGVLHPARLFVRTHRSRWKRAADAIDVEASSGSEVAEAVLAGLRDYLASRLGGTAAEAAAWTYGDVVKRLSVLDGNRMRDPANHETLEALRDVFERCEAGSYAGVEPTDLDGKRRLLADATAAVDRMEGYWR